MPNYYEQHTADETVLCSKARYRKLKKLLQVKDGEQHHGFALEWGPEDRQLYIFTEESGSKEDLPQAFLDEMARLLKQNKMPYLQFGYALTASRQVPGSCGGGEWRLMADGSMINRKSIWPDERPSIFSSEELTILKTVLSFQSTNSVHRALDKEFHQWSPFHAK